jgi:hypothetical protein
MGLDSGGMKAISEDNKDPPERGIFFRPVYERRGFNHVC